MIGNEFLINFGGEWLDVDAQSVGGFDFTTLWRLDSTRIVEKGRTMDLSVPSTNKNTRVFNDHKLIPGDGVRRGINGMVVAGGVNITGKIYVTEYSGGRYSLMMAYGQDFAGFGNVNYWSAFLADTIAFNGSDIPADTGGVPGFGWYDYGNQLSPHSIVGSPPTVHPVTNLGHVIDRLSAALGYSVTYPSLSLGRGYQAHAYGLVLPSFGVQSIQGSADVSGSAMGGFSYTLTGAATLADLGLEVSTMIALRGAVSPEIVRIECFKATRPVHLSIPDNSNVVVFGTNSHTLYNDWEGMQGAEFDLMPGDYFSFARPDEWHKVAGEYYWNRYRVPHAFEGNVSVVFSVTRAGEYPVPGDTMFLAYALPKHPLEWWLDAYCNIIFAAWTVDESTKTITVKTYGERLGEALADTTKHIALEKEKMIAVESVKRYVEGFAQHNHTHCAGDYDPVLSVYPFDRDLQMDNDYLPLERDMAEIPFNDGGIRGGGDGRYYLDINDVEDDGNGVYNYNGTLTVFFENTANSDGAVHITEILNLGVGLGMSHEIDVPSSASSVPVSYDPDYAIRSDSTNLNYALDDVGSSNYARIRFVNGSYAETYIYYNFGLSFPSDAVINNVRCYVDYYLYNTGGTSTRQLQLYSGNSPIGNPYSILTSGVRDTASLDCGSLSAVQLNAAKFRFYAQRNTSATTTDRYVRIYGARIEVDYTYKGERHYSISSASSATVRVFLPLFRFAKIGGGSCVSLHGRNFVIRNAKWSEGVAQLEMMSVSRTIPNVPRYFQNAIKDYDGNWYDAVVIGDQVWLAQNLRTTHYADGTPIPAGGSTASGTVPYYYDYSSSGIPLKDRGYLYNWPAVMKGAASSDLNPSGVQGIAPTGWHVPSDAEWTQLTNYVGSVPEYILDNNKNYIAKALASQNYWNASTSAYAVGNDLTANNKTLFSAVPAGYFDSSSFHDTGLSSHFWSSAQFNSSNAYYRYLGYYIAVASRYNNYKQNGYSVRCVCDLSPMDFAAWYYDQYGSYNHQI